jgi:hypothetical protein
MPSLRPRTHMPSLRPPPHMPSLRPPTHMPSLRPRNYSLGAYYACRCSAPAPGNCCTTHLASAYSHISSVLMYHCVCVLAGSASSRSIGATRRQLADLPRLWSKSTRCCWARGPSPLSSTAPQMKTPMSTFLSRGPRRGAHAPHTPHTARLVSARSRVLGHRLPQRLPRQCAAGRCARRCARRMAWTHTQEEEEVEEG